MGTFKKLFASIAAVMIVVSTAPVAVFGQTSWSQEYQDAYAYAYANGITTMSSIDAANLAGTTTRAQAAKMFVEFAKSLGQTADTSASCSFSDLAPIAGTDLAGFAVEACQMGLMGINTNGIFNPNGVLSRAEYGTILSRVLFGDVYNGGNPFYAAHLNALNQAGLMNDLSNPERSIMRGDAFLLLFRASTADLEGVTPGFCADIETVFACTIDPDGSMGLCPAACLGGETETPDPDSEVKFGEVTVSLNPSSVGNRSVPRTGLVPFGKFDIKAGSADVAVSSITLTRAGLSQRTDISRVYLERNGVRVSNRANITSDDLATVSFSPALVVKAGGTETLELIVELNAAANSNQGATVGAEHRFAITSAASINSSANVYGNYPVSTATATISSYVVSTVDVNNGGTTYTANVGDTNVLMAEFTLNTAGDKDNVFKSVTLRNDGDASVAASLENVKLYRDGEVVSTNVQINGRDLAIAANDTIQNGSSATYELRADIKGAQRASEDYDFEIRNTSDVVVVEKLLGFSAPITLNLLSTAYAVGQTTVTGGDINFSRDTTYSTNQSVSANTNNVTLFAGKLNVVQGVSFEDVSVTFSQVGAGLTGFNTLRLMIGNATVSTFSPTGNGTFTFDSNFNVTADTTIRIVGDLRNNASGVYQIGSVTLGSQDVRYLANDEQYGSTVVGSRGISTTVSPSGLTATKNDGITNNKIIAGANDVNLFGFSLRANDVSDVRVTSISPTKSVSGITNSQISSIKLYQGTTLLATKNNGDFNFNNLNVTIPKNQSLNFRIEASFQSSIASGSTFQLNLGTGTVVGRNVANTSETVNLAAGISSTAFVVNEAGSVKVTANSSQAIRSIVSPSTTEASVYKFDLEAESDTLRLTDVYVVRSGSLDLAEALSSASLTIGSQTTQASIINSGTLHFSFGANGVSLAPDVVRTADLKVAFFDSNARTNETFQFALPTGNVPSQVQGTQNGLRLLSDSTGSEVNRGTTTIESRAHLLARSAPTVARLAESTSSTAYKFTVTAGANRKLTVNKLHFQVSGLTGTADFTLRKEGVNAVLETVLAHDLTLSGNVEFNTFATEKDVEAGATVTYVVEISNVDTSLSGNKDRTREVKIVEMEYQDDVTSPVAIFVSPYNVLPTTASSHKY